MQSPKLICVVDDNVDYCTLTRLSIKQAYPDDVVVTFGSGIAFIDALPEMSQSPSLLLLDRHMPDLDGHQTLMFLKQHSRYKCIPVVMMSAEASNQEIKSCYASGVNSFLLKNIDAALQRETVLAVCRYWLEMNRLPDGPGFSVPNWLY